MSEDTKLLDLSRIRLEQLAKRREALQIQGARVQRELSEVERDGQIVARDIAELEGKVEHLVPEEPAPPAEVK